MHLKIDHLTVCNPRYVKCFLINPFMARAPDDQLFNPLPITNISKVVRLTHSWPIHLKINPFTFCIPGCDKGFQINPFMARAPNDYSFEPLPTKNISMVVKLRGLGTFAPLNRFFFSFFDM